MNIPSILLGFLLATLIGSIFYIIRPTGSYRRLALCIATSGIGFLVGHYTAELTGFHLWYIGMINMGGAFPGSVLALIAMQVIVLREWKW